MTPPPRSTTALRRTALLFLPVLCALASCDIPPTGVVQAGGPAGGVVPTARVYFVRGGALIGVSRPTDAPGDVDSALETLIQGPTDVERGKQITTDLPPLTGLPTLAPDTAATLPTLAPDTAATDEASVAPQESFSLFDRVTVRERDDEIAVQLSSAKAELGDLAAAQVICTAVAAQRVADPAAEPAPVRVTAADGRRVEATGAECPAD
ncbi:hypothetical protein ABZ614_29980 [Streptomyces sp. NPDC013178]|uniref:hypothetical protein n=1 Tax=Streptomyces sp. NPDC013178 TaxID=3155118 RepID=UPI0033ED527A